jgi:ABC-2 type transport system ATP-binding protein
MTIEFAEPIEAGAFERLPGITEIEVRGTQVRCRVVGQLDAVIKAAARFRVLDVTTEQPSLEEVFMEFYSGDPRRDAA